MFIFDDLIKEIELINHSFNLKKLDLKNSDFKEDSNQFIFENDKAYELGANPFCGVALNLLTDEDINDEIYLIGEDLDKINSNKNYARIVIASIDKSLIDKGNNLFNNIHKFDYVKFHFALKGIMVRESPFKHKETLLVSKSSLKDNQLNFSILGSYMINKYKSLPFVKNVKIIFVNDDVYKYDEINLIRDKCENITKALDHITKNIKMDCHTCSLQTLCNEVEKKVNEDFKK